MFPSHRLVSKENWYYYFTSALKIKIYCLSVYDKEGPFNPIDKETRGILVGKYAHVH